MQNDPPPYVWAVPDEKNILNWHYLVRGPPDSPYAGGEYHGMIMFPSEYPFKPPGIKMFTPSGRFIPDKKICFSMSDFHPGTWNPAWSVATILTGLLSFMLTEEITTGSASSNHHERVMLAARSHAWNLNQKRFRDAFPSFSTLEMRDLPNMGVKERGLPEPTAASSPGDLSPASSTVSIPGHNHQDGHPTATAATAASSVSQRLAGRHANSGTVVAAGVGIGAGGAAGAAGWPARVGKLVWEKWTWGVFMLVAILVARFSS